MGRLEVGEAVRADTPGARAGSELLARLGATIGAGAIAMGVDEPPVATPCRAPGCDQPCLDPGHLWARSGATWLTGHRSQPPLHVGEPVATAVRGAGAALSAMARAVGGQDPAVDPLQLVVERAAILGLGRRGRRSAGGASHLVETIDGWMAVSLPRAEDVDLLPAWLEGPATPAEVGRLCRRRRRADLLERAAVLGMAVAALGERTAPPETPFQLHQLGPSTPAETFGSQPPVVVDLSALWAGPLCAHLLGRAGCRVIKVESRGRPDGARRGSSAFFDVLHGGHEAVAVDFGSAHGRRRLHRLIQRADVVIEASRPRAMAQLGLEPADVVSRHPGATWVSITGFGRSSSDAHRVAFGDDAAVAGGLAPIDPEGRPVFCADALADPLAGLFAALGALASRHSGGGHVVEVAMSEVAAFVAGTAANAGLVGHPATRRGRGWVLPGTDVVVGRPSARTERRRAPGTGANTAAVLAELDRGSPASACQRDPRG